MTEHNNGRRSICANWCERFDCGRFLFVVRKKDKGGSKVKVSDYKLDFNSGAYNCCLSHIEDCNDRCYEGSIIFCDHCNKELILSRGPEGDKELMWRARGHRQ
jgi:hypothetical protein